jgi:hypothetical protein
MTEQERDVLTEIRTDVKWLKKELTDYKACQDEHTKDIASIKGDAKVWKWVEGFVLAVFTGVLVINLTTGVFQHVPADPPKQSTAASSSAQPGQHGH